jgi:hypothetical protein
MDRQKIVAVVGVLGVAGLVGTAGLIAVGGGLPAGIDTVAGETETQPELLHFEAAGSQCTDRYQANSSTAVGVGGGSTEITHAQNVSLPDRSYALGTPTFEALNDSAYVLNVPVVETAKPPRDCQGVARYNGTMRIPAGDESWQLIVKHDNEEVTTIRGNSEQSLMGGSVSVSQGVSAPDPQANNTTASDG